MAKSLEDVVVVLEEMVKVQKLSLDINRVTYQTLVGGPSAASQGAVGSESGGFPQRFDRWEGSIRGLGLGKDTAKASGKAILNRIKRSVQAGSKMGKRLGRTVGYQVGKLVGGKKAGVAAARGMGMVGGLAGGAAAGALGAVTAVVFGLVKMRDAIDRWTERSMAAAGKLAEFSASMSAVMLEREMKQIERDRNKGDAIASSQRELMKTEAKRKDQEDRISIVFSNIGNKILAVMNDVATKILEPIADTVEAIYSLMGFSLPAPSSTPWEVVGRTGLAGAEVIDRMRDAIRRSREAAEAASRGTSAPSGGGIP